MNTVKFYTLGCKVNQYDTQEIRERLLQAGLEEIEDSCPADLYVINTCTVTQRADADSLNLIRRVKRENPRAKIVVTGCLTELDEDKIKKIDGISLILKNKEKEDILKHLFFLNPQMVRQAHHPSNHPASCRGAYKLGTRRRGERSRGTRKPANPQTINGISYFKGHTRAFLKIQDGCDNFCSYCKVPLVRGRSRSRRLSEIFQEAEKLVKNGFREIVLCGICVGSYGKDLVPQTGIVDVVEALEQIQGLSRVRLSSIEAADVTEELVEKMSQSKIMCPHLHIPLQSGDNEILSKMDRHYSRDDYLGLVKRIRDRIPLVTITTDVLVGFPIEDEAGFQNTVALIKEVMPLKVHIFPYSRREATPASNNFKYAINPIIIKERISRLKAVADISATLCKTHFLGRDMDVLVEGRVKENLKFWQGYTGNYIKVIFETKKNLKNQLIRVKLKEIARDCLLGALF